MNVSQAFVKRREYRRAVLLLLVKVHQDLASPDYLNICQCLMFLDQPDGVPSILEKLLRSEKKDDAMTKIKGIWSGETSIQLTLQFLYSHNKCLIYFLNKDWLSRATNCAKFSATPGLGVIHRGHLQQGRSLMAPYLPQSGSDGGSPYSEGGALYALGLIHANHGEGIKHFLRESLRSTNMEVVQHDACLGLGLAALGTADEDICEEIKGVLYTNSAVAGEAVGISVGLLMMGTETSHC